jgi:dTDP-4-amino-4,6-dideoxygalactose transaminase
MGCPAQERNVIPIYRPDLPPLEDYVKLLEHVWKTQMLSNFADHAQHLERMAGTYLGVGTRVVSSGDVGLTCAISALEIPHGSPALVPAFTFNSTINALLWNQLVPVFVDIDADTLNMDPAAAERTAARVEPRLVVATHCFGNPVDSDGLARVAASCGASLLFDAAHGYGSIRDGVHVGGLGDVEIFSLSGTKPVTSAEGGLVTSRDPEYLERFTYTRAYGFQTDYNSRFLGLNGKMSELHAALGVLTLARIEETLARRKTLVDRYRENLKSIPGIRFQSVRPEDRSTYKDLALLFTTAGARNSVEAALSAAQVQTKRYFRPCHAMDSFRRFARETLEVTETTHERILCLPLFGDLPPEDVDMICDIIRDEMAT